MAELLIKLERASDETDLLAWGRGHVVAVQPDGWEWGRLEGPPAFIVLHIPDMTVDQAREYLAPDDEEVDGKTDRRASAGIRRWKVNVDDSRLAMAKDTGRASATKAQMASLVARAQTRAR